MLSFPNRRPKAGLAIFSVKYSIPSLYVLQFASESRVTKDVSDDGLDAVK